MLGHKTYTIPKRDKKVYHFTKCMDINNVDDTVTKLNKLLRGEEIKEDKFTKVEIIKEIDYSIFGRRVTERIVYPIPFIKETRSIVNQEQNFEFELIDEEDIQNID